MTAEDRDEMGEVAISGRTTVTGKALQRLVVGLVRDAAHVPARDVSVSLSDALGHLKAAVIVPVAVGLPGSLVDRGSAVRRAVIEGVESLAGRSVASVGVRFSGVREAPERRVS